MIFRKLLLSASLALCGFTAQANDDAVTLNLANAEISAVLKFASELTGKMFILDPKVKGCAEFLAENHAMFQAEIYANHAVKESCHTHSTALSSAKVSP